jgi:hypothetical protein
MGRMQGSGGRALVLTAAMLGAPGGSPLGDAGWARRLPTARSRVLDGEVWAVDGRRGRLQVRSARDGTNTLLVDRATRVTYGQRTYSVDALERGDVVKVWLELDAHGDAWANRVEVRQSVREKYDRYGNDAYEDDGRYGDRVERLDGRIGDVSLSSGYFTVEGAHDRVVAVYFPPSVARVEYRRIERLRPGDRVRVEVRPISGTEAELVRMR